MIMKTKGFTLVETLIAISILVLAVTGAFSAAHSGMTSALYSKDQITAFYLAQEGIEQIRNLRDQNSLTSSNWMNGIANSAPTEDPCAPGNTCYVNALSEFTPLVRCPGTAPSQTCPNLRINGPGFYSYDVGPETVETRFRREVRMTIITNNEVMVESTVYWSKGLLVDRSFTAREHLFNWQ
jgi:prepilin-type N-terminal cleavage/methylation domain